MNHRYVNLKNTSRFHINYAPKLRVDRFRTMVYLVICIIFFTAGIDVSADVFEGAAVGGFMGLVLGDDIDDVAAGAVVGAGVGAVSGSMKKKEAHESAKQKHQAKAAQKANAQQREDQALIRAIGEDNYRGLVALINCEHKRAEALANAGGASRNANHKLSSLWLRSIIANDLRQAERKQQLYKQLISADRDIDTLQQAGIEADKVLMDIRQERRAKGIACK